MDDAISVLGVGDFAPMHDISEANQKVWNFLKSKDLVVANLEVPLTRNEAEVDKAITLKADPEIAYTIPKSGIDIVTFANNHALDFGIEGLSETLDVLKKEGIPITGAGLNLQGALKPYMIKIKNVKFSFLGFTCALPTGYAAGFCRPGVAPIHVTSRFFIDNMTLDEQPGMSPWVETSTVVGDQKQACDVVKAAKLRSDVVVVNIHWGVPNGWCAAFQGPLADYQRPLAHSLIDSGADIVLGHHPHVIHGIERYGGGIIAYSLGNFLFHSMAHKSDDHLTVSSYPPYNVSSIETGEARESIIMEIVLNDKKQYSVRFYPITMNANGEPEFSEDDESHRILLRLKKLSNQLNTSIQIDKEIGVLI